MGIVVSQNSPNGDEDFNSIVGLQFCSQNGHKQDHSKFFNIPRIQAVHVNVNFNDFPINENFNDFSIDEIESIEIYSVCLREQKCQKLENIPMLHGMCLKTARLKTDCYIKCEGPCQPFSILDAGFNCSRNKVYKISNQWRFQEMFKTSVEISALVQNSLQRSNLTDDQKLSFQQSVFQSKIFQKLFIK